MRSHRICEILTEAIIYFTVVFSPWAFGTTQNWAITTMKIGAYSIGVLWVISLAISVINPRRRRAHHEHRAASVNSSSATVHQFGIATLAVLTLAILAYCYVSAFNAGATFSAVTSTFEYHQCCNWLPHSFDSNSTWLACGSYLGLASSFWAIRYWLLGKSTAEIVMAYRLTAGRKENQPRHPGRPLFPARLHRLLYVMALNGGLLATECIVQRLAKSPRLLFVALPEIHQTAATQFGPYAYRANAAQYLNLLWPVCLALGTTYPGESAHSGSKKHIVPFLCVSLMSAASLLSGSKAGAAICLGLLVCGSIVFLMSRTSADSVLRLRSSLLFPVFLGVPLLVAAMNWKQLIPDPSRLRESIHARERIYEVARQMATDFGVFGSGPATYETISEFYRPAGGGFWPAQVHNDWLELRITFGIVGSFLIIAALVVVLSRWFIPGGLCVAIQSVSLIWLALAGCLVHACVDFPFQVYSILFLFVVCLAILSVISRRP